MGLEVFKVQGASYLRGLGVGVLWFCGFGFRVPTISHKIPVFEKAVGRTCTERVGNWFRDPQCD